MLFSYSVHELLEVSQIGEGYSSIIVTAQLEYLQYDGSQSVCVLLRGALHVHMTLMHLSLLYSALIYQCI